MTEQNAEPVYRIDFLYGEAKLKPIEYRATWTSHDYLDIESDFATITNFEPQFLYMLNNVTFTNERPPRRHVGWFERLFGIR